MDAGFGSIPLLREIGPLIEVCATKRAPVSSSVATLLAWHAILMAGLAVKRHKRDR